MVPLLLDENLKVEVRDMAELYSPGIQRIFYKASKVDENLLVTAKIFDPGLVVENPYSFVKVPGKDGIYYADVNFYKEGIWIAVFYEDGDEKTVQAYNTKKVLAEGEFEFPGWDRGPGVIGI